MGRIQRLLAMIAEDSGHGPGSITFGKTADGRWHLFAPSCCGDSLALLAAELLVIGGLYNNLEIPAEIVLHLENSEVEVPNVTT